MLNLYKARLLAIPIANILDATFGILLFWVRIFVIGRLGEAIIGAEAKLGLSAWPSGFITPSGSVR